LGRFSFYFGCCFRFGLALCKVREIGIVGFGFGKLGFGLKGFFYFYSSSSQVKLSHNKSLQHRSASLHWTVFKSQFCGSLCSLYRKTAT